MLTLMLIISTHLRSRVEVLGLMFIYIWRENYQFDIFISFTKCGKSNAFFLYFSLKTR